MLLEGDDEDVEHLLRYQEVTIRMKSKLLGYEEVTRTCRSVASPDKRKPSMLRRSDDEDVEQPHDKEQTSRLRRRTIMLRGDDGLFISPPC